MTSELMGQIIDLRRKKDKEFRDLKVGGESQEKVMKKSGILQAKYCGNPVMRVTSVTLIKMAAGRSL